MAWYGAAELAIKGSSSKEPFVLIDFLLPMLFDCTRVTPAEAGRIVVPHGREDRGGPWFCLVYTPALAALSKDCTLSRASISEEATEDTAADGTIGR